MVSRVVDYLWLAKVGTKTAVQGIPVVSSNIQTGSHLLAAVRHLQYLQRTTGLECVTDCILFKSLGYCTVICLKGMRFLLPQVIFTGAIDLSP